MTTAPVAPETPPPAPPETPPPPAQETADDWKAKYEETLKEARKHEDRAKANAAAARELDALKQSSMTEQQKAVEAAKAETRTEVMREVGGKLAHAAIRVAASGRSVDVDALLEGIDASKFLDDHGDPDTKSIAAWVDRVAPAGASDADRKKNGNYVAREGTTNTTATEKNDERTFARQLFGST